MSKSLSVTYYMHSGFSCSSGRVLCVFDYWLGENEELPGQARITTEWLRTFDEVYVFISHSHPDHFQPEVLEWYKTAPVSYIISYDMPAEVRGRRMRPGDAVQLGDHMVIHAYESTDLGVSFMVELDGIRIFHAGDLNFWHWREESTTQEINEAEDEFHRAVGPLEGAKPDLAFFPLDPRQGRLFDAGANYFLMTVKPRLMVPMHFWEKTEVAMDFARRSRSRQSEIVAMTHPGEQMRLTFSDDGFMTVDLLSAGMMRKNNPPADGNLPDSDGNPFAGADLPINLRN